jgi:hypothetical protein
MSGECCEIETCRHCEEQDCAHCGEIEWLECDDCERLFCHEVCLDAHLAYCGRLSGWDLRKAGQLQLCDVPDLEVNGWHDLKATRFYRSTHGWRETENYATTETRNSPR